MPIYKSVKDSLHLIVPFNCLIVSWEINMNAVYQKDKKKKIKEKGRNRIQIQFLLK